MEAITTWDFNDGCWLKAPSGFVHEDNTEKPSYYALKQLIHGDWETHESLVTDAEGRVTVNGFKGGYTVTAGDRKAEFALEEDFSGEVVLNE